MIAGDFDTDGDIDLFTFDLNNLPTGSNPGGSFLLNDGSGSFTDFRGTANDPFSGITNTWVSSSGTFTINAFLVDNADALVADFDGDGDGDLDILNINWNENAGNRYFENTDGST